MLNIKISVKNVKNNKSKKKKQKNFGKKLGEQKIMLQMVELYIQAEMNCFFIEKFVIKI